MTIGNETQSVARVQVNKDECNGEIENTVHVCKRWLSLNGKIRSATVQCAQRCLGGGGQVRRRNGNVVRR